MVQTGRSIALATANTKERIGDTMTNSMVARCVTTQ